MENKVDRDYWSKVHPHPLAPNKEDVAIYRELIGDARNVLLLGNTPALMDLCSAAMDSDPFLDDPRVIHQDWTTNTVKYEAIIGDGVLNFTEELCNKILTMAANTTDLFVVRAFERRLPIMRIADHFPNVDDFEIKPTATYSFADYNFFVWNFKS